MEPGWRIVIPIFFSYQKIDMRRKQSMSPKLGSHHEGQHLSRTLTQSYTTKLKAQKAIIEGENFYYAVSLADDDEERFRRSQSDELLSERDATLRK